MILGVISLLLLCMGFMNAEPNMFIAAGLFAIASEMSWFIFYIRKVFGLVSKKPEPMSPAAIRNGNASIACSFMKGDVWL